MSPILYIATLVLAIVAFAALGKRVKCTSMKAAVSVDSLENRRPTYLE